MFYNPWNVILMALLFEADSESIKHGRQTITRIFADCTRGGKTMLCTFIRERDVNMIEHKNIMRNELLHQYPYCTNVIFSKYVNNTWMHY